MVHGSMNSLVRFTFSVWPVPETQSQVSHIYKNVFKALLAQLNDRESTNQKFRIIEYKHAKDGQRYSNTIEMTVDVNAQENGVTLKNSFAPSSSSQERIEEVSKVMRNMAGCVSLNKYASLQNRDMKIPLLNNSTFQRNFSWASRTAPFWVWDGNQEMPDLRLKFDAAHRLAVSGRWLGDRIFRHSMIRFGQLDPSAKLNEKEKIQKEHFRKLRDKCLKGFVGFTDYEKS